MLRRSFCLSSLLAILLGVGAASGAPLKALIIEGQNNHKAWPKTTVLMKQCLEQTGLFTVDVARTAPKGVDPTFHPEFAKYDVVISNYTGASWPESTKEAFVKYVKGGGGFVAVHAADNAFPDWPEYNELIALGGWGGRNEQAGPYVYLDKEGNLVRDTSPGKGGHHGPQREYQIVIRDGEHPVTKGMPSPWLHVKDELYDMLRGPAKNMHILATAYSDETMGGTGRHEPMILTVQFGEGRSLHITMGHDETSCACVGFIVTLQRGAEWAATGKVTQPIPDDFPTADSVSQRPFSNLAP